MKRAFIVAAAMALVASTAMAATLLKIEPLAGDETMYTQGRAITPDGKYVAGVSGQHGIFWSPTAGSSQVIERGRQATTATGIGYRTITSGKEVVVGGLSSGWVTAYGAPDPGAGAPAWAWSARDIGTGSTPNLPVANSVGGTTTDKWYITFDDANPVNNKTFWGARGQGDPTGSMTGTYGPLSTIYESDVRGMSGTGRMAVARRLTSDSSAYQNYYYDYAGTATPRGTKFKGLKAGSYDGEPRTVSLDGTKLSGMAPVDGGREGNWPYFYDVTTDTIVELPTFGDGGFATTNGIVYGLSADGRWAVGMDYTKGIELAVLWDTTASPIKEIDLTAFATACGILDGFTGNLRRAYAVGVNDLGQPVVTGFGVYTPDGTPVYRGFVLTVPEPATVGFLALALLFVGRRRKQAPRSDGDFGSDGLGET